MNCTYCQGGRAKRACPALDGAICSLCCGTHRMAEIACPMSCSYLGGLAAFADPDMAVAETTAEAMVKALAVLSDFSTGTEMRPFARDALESYGYMAEATSETEFDSYLLYLGLGHRDARGKRLIDLYLDERRRKIGYREAAALVGLLRSRATLARVERIEPGGRVVLEDLLQPRRFEVDSRDTDESFFVGGVLYGVFSPAGDRYCLIAGALLAPESEVELLKGAIERELDRLRAQRPGVPEDHLTVELAPRVYDMIGTLEGPPDPFNPADPLGGWQAGIAGLLGSADEETDAEDEGLDTEALAEVEELFGRYDPGTPLDPATWLSLEDDARPLLAEAHHQTREAPHPPLSRPRLHAVLHAVIENQLAGGKPLCTRDALDHLMRDGLSRHEAIHAISGALIAEIREMLEKRQDYDEGRFAGRLAHLVPDDFRGTAP